jgi:hypothetical protein
MPMESELVNALYGLLGLGALCVKKYMYPSLKKFFVRKFGRKDVMDPRFRDQIMLNFPEITRIMSKNFQDETRAKKKTG